MWTEYRQSYKGERKSVYQRQPTALCDYEKLIKSPVETLPQDTQQEESPTKNEES